MTPSEANFTLSSRPKPLHPLVEQARRSLAHSNTTDHGFVYPRKSPCLDIRVAPDMVGRALEMMDVFCREAEKAGYRFVLNEEPKQRTLIEVDGVPIEIAIMQYRVKHALPRDSRYSWQPYEWVPTGPPYFAIREYYGDRRQLRWSDGARRLFQSRVPRILETLRAIATERLERHAQCERERKESEECERRRREEKQRVDHLYREVDAWHKSRQIREYVEAVRHAVLVKYGRIDPDSEAEQWLRWAEGHADWLDPLKPPHRSGQHAAQPPLSSFDSPHLPGSPAP